MAHLCHARGCTANVAPKLFMCRKHWFMLTEQMRRNVWRAYRKCQEIDKTPSKEYIEVTTRIINWLAQKEIAAAQGRMRI